MTLCLSLLREGSPAAKEAGEPLPFATPLGEAAIHRFEEDGRRHRAYLVMLGAESLILDFVRAAADTAGGSLADAMLSTLSRIELP